MGAGGAGVLGKGERVDQDAGERGNGVRFASGSGECVMLKLKLLSAFAPTVPMWEVYYYDDDGTLGTAPVVALALAEPDEEDSDRPDLDRWLVPITLQDTYFDFSGEPMSRWASNLLGYSFTGSPDPANWADEIKRYLDKKAKKP